MRGCRSLGGRGRRGAARPATLTRMGAGVGGVCGEVGAQGARRPRAPVPPPGGSWVGRVGVPPCRDGPSSRGPSSRGGCCAGGRCCTARGAGLGRASRLVDVVGPRAAVPPAHGSRWARCRVPPGGHRHGSRRRGCGLGQGFARTDQGRVGDRGALGGRGSLAGSRGGGLRVGCLLLLLRRGLPVRARLGGVMSPVLDVAALVGPGPGASAASPAAGQGHVDAQRPQPESQSDPHTGDSTAARGRRGGVRGERARSADTDRRLHTVACRRGHAAPPWSGCLGEEGFFALVDAPVDGLGDEGFGVQGQGP